MFTYAVAPAAAPVIMWNAIMTTHSRPPRAQSIPIEFRASPTISGILQDQIAIIKKVIPINWPKVINSGVGVQPADPKKDAVKNNPPIAFKIPKTA